MIFFNYTIQIELELFCCKEFSEWISGKQRQIVKHELEIQYVASTHTHTVRNKLLENVRHYKQLPQDFHFVSIKTAFHAC